MWVPPEDKDPILLLAPTRKSVSLFGAVNLRNGKLVTQFEKKFNEWCKSNRHREMSSVVLGRSMKEKAIEQRLLYANWMNDGRGGNARAWIGLKWKYQDKQD
jgi:hypothetical protein